MDDATRREILGETLMDELRVIREYLEYLMPMVQKVNNIEQDVTTLKDDMHMMKLLYKDHEQRITRLEVAGAATT